MSIINSAVEKTPDLFAAHLKKNDACQTAERYRLWFLLWRTTEVLPEACGWGDYWLEICISNGKIKANGGASSSGFSDYPPDWLIAGFLCYLIRQKYFSVTPVQSKERPLPTSNRYHEVTTQMTWRELWRIGVVLRYEKSKWTFRFDERKTTDTAAGGYTLLPGFMVIVGTPLNLRSKTHK